MSSILKPGYVRWDGLKYVLDPGVEIVGPEGPVGPQGPPGIAAGPAGGDLGGDYPNPRVIGLQGNPILNVLPSNNQVLEWNGAEWQPADLPTIPSSLPPDGPAGGDLSGSYPNPTVISAGGHPIITIATSAGGDLTGVYPNPTIAKLQGVVLPAPSGSDTVLTFNAGSLSWAAAAGGLDVQLNSTDYGTVSVLRLLGGQSDPLNPDWTPIPQQVQVVSGTPYTFPSNTTSQVQIAYCQTSGGATTVTFCDPTATGYGGNFQQFSGFTGSGYWLRVVDDQNSAATHNITVNAQVGHTLEDPNSPGTFSSSITLSKNSAAVTWEWDASKWKIVSSFYATSSFTAGGDLSGTSSSQQVVSITGTGTNSYSGSGASINIAPTETILASGTNFHVDSFVLNSTLVGTGAFQNLFTFNTVTGQIYTDASIDWHVSILGVDSANTAGVYRADLTFTTIVSGSSLNNILQSGNPQNERKQAPLAAATSQVTNSGQQLQIQVSVTNGVTVKWSMIAQLQYRL